MKMHKNFANFVSLYFEALKVWSHFQRRDLNVKIGSVEPAQVENNWIRKTPNYFFLSKFRGSAPAPLLLHSHSTPPPLLLHYRSTPTPLLLHSSSILGTEVPGSNPAGKLKFLYLPLDLHKELRSRFLSGFSSFGSVTSWNTWNHQGKSDTVVVIDRSDQTAKGSLRSIGVTSAAKNHDEETISSNGITWGQT